MLIGLYALHWGENRYLADSFSILSPLDTHRIDLPRPNSYDGRTNKDTKQVRLVVFNDTHPFPRIDHAYHDTTTTIMPMIRRTR